MSIQCETKQCRSTQSTLFACAICALLLSACGNKGDLFLVSDAVTQDELQSLQQDLEALEVPTASPADVDDGAVYIDLEAETEDGKPQDRKTPALPQ